MTHRQSRQELEEHFRRQVGFLHTSAAAFDSGVIAEASRLATSIRVLLHDGQGASLLGQLGLKDQLGFLDTATDPIPGNLAPTNGLVTMGIGGTGPVFHAPFGEGSPRRQNKPRKAFEDWWNAVVIIDGIGTTFTRKDLVLALANKDGGAHVDPELNAAYAALSRSGSLGWMISDDTGARPMIESPVPASVRQIAYELEQTFFEQLNPILQPADHWPPADL